MEDNISSCKPRVKSCELRSRRNGLDVYEPKTSLLASDETHKIKVLHIGEVNTLLTKNILLIGETGAGKTRLINQLYNHICNVKYSDTYRLEIHDEVGERQKRAGESQTEYITGYLFYHGEGMRYNYNILIIDTPGLNDVGGIGKQKTIESQMKVFLGEVKFGILELHCLGIVVKASLNRCHQYMIDFHKSCLKLFGKDTEDVTYVFATHGTQKTENLEDVLNEIGLNSGNISCFDNGMLYDPNTSAGIQSHDDISINKLLWNKMSKVNDDFFRLLENIPSVTLKLTRGALRKKAFIEKMKENLSREVRDAVIAFAVNQSYMTSNINQQWKYTKTEQPVQKTRFYHFFPHAHNCNTCEKSCFYVCHMWIFCPDTSTDCIYCSCPAENHVRSEFIIKKQYIKEDLSETDKRKTKVDAEPCKPRIAESVTKVANWLNHLALATKWHSEICRVSYQQSAGDILLEITQELNVENMYRIEKKDLAEFVKSVLKEAKRVNVNEEELKSKLDAHVEKCDNYWYKAEIIRDLKNQISPGKTSWTNRVFPFLGSMSALKGEEDGGNALVIRK